MKFIVDAQLPRRIAHMLRSQGHDALHTLDLPEGNRTTDAAILELATSEDRIVITKDDDFVNSLLLAGRPEKLLLVSTGNIKNAILENIFTTHLTDIVAAFETAVFIELNQTAFLIHA